MKDWLETLVTIFLLPLGGWVISVERRLAKIDSANEKLDLILEHVLPNRGGSDKGRR